MKFTDKQISNLKPTGQPFELRETDGFILAVSAKGKKVFYHIWKRGGKNYRLNLGTYPSVTLSEARDKHRAALTLRHKGEDPRNVAPVHAPVTVAILCNDYIELWAKPRKRQWETIDKRFLDKEVIPIIGHIQADKLHRRDVVSMLNAIVARPSPASANQTLKILKRVFSFSVEQGTLEVNQIHMIKMPAETKQKSRVLSDEEIKIFWLVISSGGKVSPEIRGLLRFILVTGQRPGECNGLNYSEISNSWWTIPPDRHKQHKAHSVYLSPLAISLTRYRNRPYGVEIRSVSSRVCKMILSGALPCTLHTTRPEAHSGQRHGVARCKSRYCSASVGA